MEFTRRIPLTPITMENFQAMRNYNVKVQQANGSYRSDRATGRTWQEAGFNWMASSRQHGEKMLGIKQVAA